MAEAGEGGAPGLSSPPRAPAGGAPRGGSWAGHHQWKLGTGALLPLQPCRGRSRRRGCSPPPIQVSPGMLLTLAPHALCALLLL